jgi:hypothetical protein
MVTAEATLTRGTHQTGESIYQLGEFHSYREAVRVVDRLSGAGIPVEQVRVVELRPRSVEQMTGGLTTVRAMLLGAGLGGWLGILTGLVLALSVAGSAWVSVLLGGLLIGAFLGGLVGLVIHRATDGRRDFAATTGLRAQRYTVEVDRGHAAEAVQVLGRT